MTRLKRIAAMATTLASVTVAATDPAKEAVDALSKVLKVRPNVLAIDMSPTGDGTPLSPANAKKVDKVLKDLGFKSRKGELPTLTEYTKGNVFIYTFDYEVGEDDIGLQFGEA